MAVLGIVEVGNPVLREPTKPIIKVTKKTQKLIQDMFDTMYAVDGVGLAAPQVGVNVKLVVIDIGEGPLTLINPEIKTATGEEIDVEGCLSVPGKQAYVRRAQAVMVEAFNEKGKPIRIEADGLFARCLQHEIDHLNGILYIDLVEEDEIVAVGGEE